MDRDRCLRPEPALAAFLAQRLITSDGTSVDQKFSNKVGHQVTGCEKKRTVSYRAFYQCDHGVSGDIDANGRVLHVYVTSTSSTTRTLK